MWQAGSSGAPGRRWPQNQATFDDDHKLSHCTVSSPPVNHPRSQNPLPPLHTLGSEDFLTHNKWSYGSHWINYDAILFFLIFLASEIKHVLNIGIFYCCRLPASIRGQVDKGRKISLLYFICLHDVTYKASGRCLISSSDIYSIHCEISV